VLGVEAVGPAPARYEIGFVGLEDGGHLFDVFLWSDAGADEKKMRGDPGEVERGERAEKVSAVDGAEPVGQDEVVDDACPEAVGHTKAGGGHGGESFEAEERVGWEDEGPDLVEVGVGDLEGVDHGGDVGLVFGGGAGLGEDAGGLGAADALPGGGFGIDIAEERAGDLGEQGVEVGSGGLGEGAGADLNFGDGVVGCGCGGDGPDEGIVLIAGGESLGVSGEALGHAEGEAEIDGEGEAGARGEESSGDGVEDGGVDEAFARAEVVAGYGEVAFERCRGEGAEGFGVEGLGFDAEEEAGGGLILLGELEGVEIVGCGEDPGSGGDGGGGVGEETEWATGGEGRGGVRGGDQDGLAGEGEGEVGEGGLEGFGRQRDQADKQVVRGGDGGFGGDVQVGLSGGHRFYEARAGKVSGCCNSNCRCRRISS
jgi:hypothetical protein